MAGLVVQGFFPRGVKVPAQLPAHLSRLPLHGGQPLPADVRQRMEAALGQRFDQVRVHVGPHVQAVGALAFTQGTNIHFAFGQYNPSTPQGRQMLAHELAHVVQQRSGRVQNPMGSGTAVVQDQQLEAEAERMAQRVTLQSAAQPPGVQQAKPVHPNVVHPSHARAPLAQPRPVATRHVPLPRHVPPRSVQPMRAGQARPAIVQPFSIVSGDRILSSVPKKRPWFGYPYVVAGGSISFMAQQRNGLTDGDEFLTVSGADSANIRNASKYTLSLRVSDDGNMAIEDSDLTNRQPKVFYATAEVISASNQRLQEVGSIVTLQRASHYIKVITGWYSEVKVLYRVQPQFSKLPKQNCNDFSEQVTGAFTEARGPNAVLTTTDRLLNEENVDYRERALDYVRISTQSPGRVRRLGANQHANAGVGEAYMIVSIGKPEREQGKFAWIRDIRSNELRKVAWPYHFAGVVARSGHDTITLENYARGDDRKGGFDPRWYFQMYSGNSGQSFHEQHAPTGHYANPLTVVARQDDVDLPRLGPTWLPVEPITLL